MHSDRLLPESLSFFEVDSLHFADYFLLDWDIFLDLEVGGDDCLIFF